MDQFNKEINFTQEQLTELNNLHKEDEVESLEPWRKIVKKPIYKLEMEIKKLMLQNDQQEPFIGEKEQEFKAIEAEFFIVHEIQEALHQKKTA